MKLYSTHDSPFSAAVRLAIYAKGLDVDILPPPGGLLSAQYHAINPVGTIPCLMLTDDEPLSESLAILEYFEDRFPDVPLLAGSAEARARTRLLGRIAELGVLIPLARLVQPGPDAQSASSGWLTRLVRGLASLNHLLAVRRAPDLTLADCFLVPALFILPHVAKTYGKEALLEAYPDLQVDAVRLETSEPARKVHSELATHWH